MIMKFTERFQTLNLYINFEQFQVTLNIPGQWHLKVVCLCVCLGKCFAGTAVGGVVRSD